MRSLTRMLLLAALLLVPASSLRAQTAADPSGHWEGLVLIPGLETMIELDLAKDSRGEIGGTFSTPAQNIKGLPLLNVAVEGKAVKFYARRDQTFEGAVSADGKSMSGDFIVGANAIPFSLTRTGDPRLKAGVRSAAIGKDLEGTWNSTLGGNGMPLRLVLTMTNEPGDTASGNIVNLDEGGLTIPIASITQKAASVTLDLEAVGGSYSGVLNAEGTELAGTLYSGISRGVADLPARRRQVGLSFSK